MALGDPACARGLVTSLSYSGILDVHRPQTDRAVSKQRGCDRVSTARPARPALENPMGSVQHPTALAEEFSSGSSRDAAGHPQMLVRHRLSWDTPSPLQLVQTPVSLGTAEGQAGTSRGDQHGKGAAMEVPTPEA